MSVIHHDLAGQEIGADSGFVASAELLVDLDGTTCESMASGRACRGFEEGERRKSDAYILVHQTSLADTAVAEDDDLDAQQELIS